jgi:hypothetical protein
MAFKPGGGQIRGLKVDPAKKEQLILAFLDIMGTKPAAPQQRTRPTAANAAGAPPATKPPDPAAADKTTVIKKDQ